MLRKKYNWNAIIALLLMLGVFATPIPAEEVSAALEQRIGRTLLNTVKGRTLEDPPTPELMQEFRDAGVSEVGESWGVIDQVKSRLDGKMISVSLNITVVPADHKPSKDDVEKWRAIVVDTHTATSAEIGFRETKRGDVRRHRVYYRLESGAIRLSMNVTRTGDETVKEAIALTTDGFAKFHKQAVEQGLLESAEASIRLVAEKTPESPETVVLDGDVIEAPYLDGGPLDVNFIVSAITPLIKADEAYKMDVQIEGNHDSKGSAFLGSDGRPLPDTDGDGWNEVAIPRGDTPGQLTLHFDKFQTKAAKDNPYALDEFVVGAIRVNVNSNGDSITIRFGVQRRAWHVIVQRFELMPEKYQPTKEEFENSKGVVYDLDGRLGFNKYVGNGGKLIENYEDLLQSLAAPRGEIAANDSVCMSWQRDHYSAKSYEFLVAVDSPKVKEKLPAIAVGVRSRLLIDFKVVQAPLRTRLSTEPAVKLDEFGDPIITADTDDDPFDGLEAERVLRRQIRFDELSITRQTIIESLRNEEAAAFQSKVSGRLRKEPTQNEGVFTVYKTNFVGGREIDTHFPLTNRYSNPDASAENRNLAFAGGIVVAPHRFPGTFEIRLRAKVERIGDPEPKEVDVAIRYAISPTEFKAFLIDWESQRGN